MRTLFLFIISLGTLGAAWTQLSVYDCASYPTLEQADIEQAGETFYRPCVAFETGETFDFHGSFQHIILTATAVSLSGDVHIHDLAATSVFWFKPPTRDVEIEGELFDIVVMEYDDLEHISKLDKLELGVQLPSEIKMKVDDFVNGNPSGNVLNPYLDWEVRVYATFTPVSGSLDPIVIDGFYTKDFYSVSVDPLPDYPNDNYTAEQYKTIGHWNEISTDYPFRIRFAPPDTGAWQCAITIVTPDTNHVSEDFSFEVIESDNPGYMKVGSNGRYLSYNGRTFYPIGANLPWPETDTLNDPELYNKLSGAHDSGIYYSVNEGYMDVYAAPRVYQKYKGIMHEWAQKGANYIRTIMYPASTEIEWEELGNYTGRLHMAKEMDDILNEAMYNGQFLHFDMQIHYSFQNSVNAYSRLWTWDKQMQGADFCYKDIDGINTPVDFLSNAEAKKFYKQRLRYILARWGYSTNIAVFELMSEINNIGTPGADAATYYLAGDNWIPYRDWNVEMAEYVKSTYAGKQHLLTASYTGGIDEADDTYEHPEFDVISINNYNYGAPLSATFWNNSATLAHLDQLDSSSLIKNENIKPVIYGEIGAPNATARWGNERGCERTYIELKRTMWQSLFSGIAGGLPWAMIDYPELYKEWAHMRYFISRFELDGNRWYPGTLAQLSSGTWMNGGFLDYDESSVGEEVDAIYLVSGDGNYALGVITNKTFNAESVTNRDHCFIWDGGVDANNKPLPNITDEVRIAQAKNKNGGIFSPALKLMMPHEDEYYITYFDADNLVSPENSSDDSGSEVDLDVTVGAIESQFVMPFMVRRNGHVFEDIVYPLAIVPIIGPVNDIAEGISMRPRLATIEANTIKGIEIFPSPTSDLLTVRMDCLGCSGTIHTMDGRSAHTFELSANTTVVDMEELQAGTYILRILNGTEVLITRKIIKL